MPSSSGGIRVNPNGQTAVVTFTLPNGGTPVAYSSKSGSGTVALPATVTTETTFWFQEQTTFTVSALVGTQQSATSAGTTAAVDLSGGGVAGLTVAVVGASGGSLVASYVPQTKATIGWVGDSIAAQLTAVGVTNALHYADGFIGWSQVLSNHRLDLTYLDAQPGTAISGADFPARLTAAVASGVGVLGLEFGSNDVAGGGTSAAIKTAYRTAITAAKAAKMRVLITTAPPRNSLTSGQRTIHGQLNAWLRALPSAYPHVVIADMGEAVTDPLATNPATWVAAYTTDGTHPNTTGSALMGRVVASAINSMSSASAFQFLTQPMDAGNLLGSKAQFAPRGGTAAPNVWYPNDTTAAWSDVARTDGIAGSWKRAVVPVGGITQFSASFAGWSAGDKIRAFLEFRTSGVQSPLATYQSFCIFMQAFQTPSYTLLRSAGDLYTGAQASYTPPDAGVFLTPIMDIPASTGEIDLYIRMQGGATYDLGRVGVLNLTTGAVVDLTT